MPLARHCWRLLAASFVQFGRTALACPRDDSTLTCPKEPPFFTLQICAACWLAHARSMHEHACVFAVLAPFLASGDAMYTSCIVQLVSCLPWRYARTPETRRRCFFSNYVEVAMTFLAGYAGR